MFKKVLSLLLASLLLFLFFGCTSDNIELPSDVSEETNALNDETIVTEDFEEELQPSPLFWKATSENGSVIWLFGGISEGKESFYPLPENIISAFNKSPVLAVEFNVSALLTDIDLQYKLMTDYQFYNDGTKVSDIIDSQLFDETVKILSACGVYSPGFESLKPVFLQSLVDSLISAKAGLSDEYSLDSYFISNAEKSGKKIFEIESAEEQYKILSSFSSELQELMLSETVKGYKDRSAFALRSQLADAWQKGDAEFLENQTIIPKEKRFGCYLEYHQKMFENRNQKMLDYCVSQLQSGEEAFVCVGLAHLLGNDGIINKLSSLGFTVERI